MRFKRRSCLLSLCLSALLVALTDPSFAEENWARYRGPLGTGQSNETALPTKWDTGDVQWRAELDGQGQSSPCIWGEKIFLTMATSAGEKAERSVVCISRKDGKILWSDVASTGPTEKVHKMNGYATPTCASDGERVVAYFGRGGIHCYDMDGKKLWSRDLGEFPGPWGTGASPMILGNVVIQNCDAQGDSYLVALDKKTGKQIWRTERRSLPRGGWSTPVLIDTGERKELVLNGEFGAQGYDPKTGKDYWYCKSFNGRGTPAPVFGHGMVFVVNGKPGDIYAVRPGGSGDVTATHMAWHTPRRGGRDLPSPILSGDYLFVVGMSGVGTCYDASSGTALWEARLGGNYSGSPIAAGGLFYVQNETGETLVIRPGKKYDLVARNPIGAKDGEIFRCSMAPSQGQIFTRSNRALYCIGKRTVGTAQAD